MRQFRIVSLALTVAAVGSMVALGALGSANALAGEKGKAVRVHLHDVEVLETQKNGDAWDINDGKPDLRVRIKNMSDKTVKEFVSKEKEDTYKATYNVPTILASAGHKLEIEVVDVDVAVSDRIGLHKLTLTQEMLDKGKLTLSFDRVKTLNIEFKAP